MSIEEEIEELKSLDELMQQTEAPAPEPVADAAEKIPEEENKASAAKEVPQDYEYKTLSDLPDEVPEDASEEPATEVPKQNILEQINEKLDSVLSPSGKKMALLLLAVLLIAGVYLLFVAPKSKQAPANNDIPALNRPVKDMDEGAVADRPVEMSEEIEIEEDTNIIPNDGSMSSFSLDDFGRANPFVPDSESISDVRKYGFDIMAPPETLATDTPATQVMATKISGIMYDAVNPSAILNIEGEDYFVHSGDYINNYRVLAIGKDVVTVQLGVNVYKARVGEVIPDGTVNYNNVYDLENKFGGARR